MARPASPRWPVPVSGASQLPNNSRLIKGAGSPTVPAGPIGAARYAVPLVDSPQLPNESRMVGPLRTGSATTFNDSGSGTITLTGSGAESASAADSGTGTITLTGSSSESFSTAGAIGQARYAVPLRDAPPLPNEPRLLGPLTTANASSDFGTGTIILGGTSSESLIGSGSASGTITLSGTSIEHLSYTDAGAGTITLTGSGTDSYVVSLAPIVSVLPVLSGTPAYDSFGNLSLACSTGTWVGPGPITYTYQWQEDDDGDGAFVNILGATSSTFTDLLSKTPYTHLGNRVRCVVTATNTHGSGFADSLATPTIVVAPTVSTPGSGTMVAFANAELFPSLSTFPGLNVFPEGPSDVMHGATKGSSNLPTSSPSSKPISPASPGSTTLVPADFP